MATTKKPDVYSIERAWEEQPVVLATEAQCFKCKHFFLGSMTCAAFFPLQIPEEIFRNEIVHDAEYPGDEGIVFERGDPVTPDAAS